MGNHFCSMKLQPVFNKERYYEFPNTKDGKVAFLYYFWLGSLLFSERESKIRKKPITSLFYKVFFRLLCSLCTSLNDFRSKRTKYLVEHYRPTRLLANEFEQINFFNLFPRQFSNEGCSSPLRKKKYFAFQSIFFSFRKRTSEAFLF